MSTEHVFIVSRLEQNWGKKKNQGLSEQEFTSSHGGASETRRAIISSRRLDAAEEPGDEAEPASEHPSGSEEGT